MQKAALKSFAKPDEVREFPKGKIELLRIGDRVVGRATFQPVWKWSTSVKPLVKTKSCEAPHLQYHVSGRLRVVMDAAGAVRDLDIAIALIEEAGVPRCSAVVARLLAERHKRSRALFAEVGRWGGGRLSRAWPRKLEL